MTKNLENRNLEEKFADDIQRGAAIVNGKPQYSMTVPYRETSILKRWTGKLKRLLFVQNKVDDVLKNHVYIFTPSVLCNVTRIAEVIMKIPKELYGESVTEGSVSSAAEHLDDMAYIIAAAVQNNYLEPEPALIERIKKSFSMEQILQAISYSFIQLRINEFVQSIILVKGTVNIIKPSDKNNNDVEIVDSRH